MTEFMVLLIIKTPEDIIEDYNNNGYNPKIRNLRV